MQSEAAAGVREHKEFQRPVRLLRDEEGVPVQIVYTGPMRLSGYYHANPIKRAAVQAAMKLGVKNPTGDNLDLLEQEGLRELEMRNEELRRNREVI